MKSEICFTLTDTTTGKPFQLCIFIPYLIDPWWWLKPEPAPRPWLDLKGLKTQVADDLVILNTIDALSEKLSPAFAKRIQGITKESLEASVQALPAKAALKQVAK